MTLLAMKHPVQLLSDARGIYGVGVVDRAVDDDLGRPRDIILRPDRLLEAQTPGAAALQMIIGGFRHGMFGLMAEEHLRQHIHRELLHRRGLTWPYGLPKLWSEDSKQQVRNRQIYHGLRLASLAFINSLVREALEAAAEPNALALARRFPFRQRYTIYRATAPNHRALQLTDVFPALGLSIFGRGSSAADVNLVSEAKQLVEGGAPLRKIAELMGVPMAFRRAKPAAAHLALAVVDAFEDPRLIDAHMPESLTKMRLWLKCVRLAQRVGPDFVQWTSRHAVEIVGSSDEVVGILKDIEDWVLACYRASVPLHIQRAILSDPTLISERGEQFVHRRFNADMSLATVTQLSADWHEAVAANMTGGDQEFPDPWCLGDTFGGFDIVPITSSAELYREGKRMHHCAGTYAGQVHSGDCYIFSVQKDGSPLATLQLARSETGVAIGQFRGRCNAKPSKEALRAVNSWLRGQREFRIPDRTPYRLIDDDIPF